MRAREFTDGRVMAKIEDTGKIVQILRHEDHVDFSDEPGWFLINTNPDTKSHMGVKWIPDSTRFVWVRNFESLKESTTATARQVLSYINRTHHEPFRPGEKMHAAVMAHPRWELRRVPLLNLNIPDQEYDDVDYDEDPPESDPYNRVMTVDPGHAGEVSQHLIDKNPIVIDADRYIIDGNHRAWAAKYLLNRDYINAWVPVKQKVNEARIPRAIEDFLDGLSPDDVGVEEFGPYRVHFEGFTDDCQSSSDYRRNPEAVYQQVYADFVQREGGRRPIIQDMTGDEDYPILYSIFKIPRAVKEAFDQPYPMTWEKSEADDSMDALARLPDGSNLSIMFNQDYDDEGEGIYSVEFWRGNSQEVTGAGDSQRVFATVLEAIKQFIQKRNPEQLYFSANKDVEPGQKAGTRSNLYTSLVRRYARALGYEADVSDFAGSTTYKLYRLNEQIQEVNYPDELTVSDQIQEYFFKRGYQLAGEGRDQMAFESPRGTIVKVLGTGDPEREQIVRDYVTFFEKNQRNPFYPRIYSSGEFAVDGETYFVYEMERVNYVANEEQTLDYIEKLMAAVDREQGEQFLQRNPVPAEMSEEEIYGLIQATEDMIQAIGGMAPLDLSAVENLGRRDNGHLVIVDPFSL